MKLGYTIDKKYTNPIQFDGKKHTFKVVGRRSWYEKNKSLMLVE